MYSPSAAYMEASTFKSVDFPAPLSPSSAMRSPFWSVRSTCFKISRSSLRQEISFSVTVLICVSGSLPQLSASSVGASRNARTRLQTAEAAMVEE